MTMKEQMEMSGLEFMPSSPLQWNSTNQWPLLLGGGRQGQACVTIGSETGENDSVAQTIVVIGGQLRSHFYTNSVIIWDPSTKRWRTGPSLNDGRANLVVVVCHDKVYVIGGFRLVQHSIFTLFCGEV